MPLPCHLPPQLPLCARCCHPAAPAIPHLNQTKYPTPLPPAPRYKFIYIRTPKAASTSIVDVLGECGNKNTGAQLKPHCMAHSWDVSATPEDVERYWSE